MDHFGHSISLSSNGNIVAIGAPNNSENGNVSGQVRIFENSLGNWTQIGNSINGDNIADGFGNSVSLSNDGSILAVSAWFNDENGSASGQVKVFQNLSGNWMQIGNNINGEAAGDFSGYFISLSGDGNKVAISAVRNNGNRGHVRIYENILGNWEQVGNDIDGETTSDYFGYSVSLSNDGSIVAIGERGNFASENTNGNVRIYQYISGNWVKIGGETNENDTANFSGYSVSISNDGSVVAIGAPLNSNIIDGYEYGRVRIINNISGSWVQIGSDINGEIEGTKFGYSVSLSGDGNTLMVGAPGFLNYVGIYDLSELLSQNEQKLLNFNLFPNPTKNQVTIQLNNTTELESIAIYNNLGQQVLTSKETVINTSKLASGLYLVDIETNKGKGSKKLIID